MRLSVALFLGLVSCEQRQDTALNFYRQIQKEAQMRDEMVKKQLEDMQRGMVALTEAVDELKVKQGRQDPDAAEKMADVVAERVAAKLMAQNAASLAEMKAQLDSATKNLAAQANSVHAPSGAVTAPTGSEYRRVPAPPGELPVDGEVRTRPSDPNRKTYRIDFGDGR